MSIIRPFAAEDLESLYAICLATGDSGQDATSLYQDGKLIGHIYAGPYGVLAPELAFVVEDDAGVAGYVIGTIDTRAFDAQLERDWWPALRAQYPDPTDIAPEARNADQKRAFAIHHPDVTPDEIVDAFPGHMHMDLLPRLQGQGFGKRLFKTWVERAAELGATGVHVGVGSANPRGMAFWQAMGFVRRPVAGSNAIWLGQPIDR